MIYTQIVLTAKRVYVDVPIFKQQPKREGVASPRDFRFVHMLCRISKGFKDKWQRILDGSKLGINGVWEKAFNLQAPWRVLDHTNTCLVRARISLERFGNSILRVTWPQLINMDYDILVSKGS